MTVYPSEEIEIITRIAEQASSILMQYFRSDVAVSYKDKKEPVTIADQKANECIMNELLKYFPNDGIISEEQPIMPSVYQHEKIWFVDPLDGTKRFIKGEDDFSVMIGRVENGVPNLGVILMPAKQRLYFAQAGFGAYMKTINNFESLSASDTSKCYTLAISRTASEKEIESLKMVLPITKIISISSVGVKIGKLLEHEANLYLHLNEHTKVWDSCAPHAVYISAGGSFTDLFGNPIDYLNHEKPFNSYGLVACGAEHFQQVIAGVRPIAEKLQLDSHKKPLVHVEKL